MNSIKSLFARIPRDHYALTMLFLILAGSVGYVAYREYTHTQLLNQEVTSLRQQLASTTALLQNDIATTHTTLAEEINNDRNNVSAIKSELGNFQQVVTQEVGTISGSVKTLEKLSETDPELLQKYSKVFFLSEHYAPERLAAVDKKYLYYESRPESVHASIAPKLKAMLDAASAQKVPIYVRSAYRSFDEQKSLKNAYSVTYGSGANAFSADQGYSEHQLGTTIDFITTGLGGELDGFDGTSAYQWLLSNAYKYGFVMSYPPGNQYYIFEPWHWRFVGVQLATYLKNNNKNFYDLDQRTIDGYLVNIFD